MEHRTKASLAAILALSVAACGGESPAGPNPGTVNPAEGWIVFVRDSADIYRIAAMRPSGDGLRFLSPPSPRSISRLRISGDGSRVVGYGDGRVLAVDSDGSNLVEFEAPAGFEIEHVSRNGQLLVWFHPATISEQFFALATTTTHGPDVTAVPISTGIQRIDGVAFHRSGLENRIVMSARFEGSGFGSELYSLRRDGSDVQRLTDNEEVVFEPLPDPDGRRIAFLTQPSVSTSTQVILGVIDSGGASRIILGADDVGDSGWVRMKVWSRDGDKLLAWVTSRLSSSEGIWTVDESGASARNLIRSGLTPTALAWSPRGDALVMGVQGSGGGDLLLADGETGEITDLTRTQTVAETSPLWVE